MKTKLIPILAIQLAFFRLLRRDYDGSTIHDDWNIACELTMDFIETYNINKDMTQHEVISLWKNYIDNIYDNYL